MQRPGAGSKFATRILSEVCDLDFADIDFSKSHRASFSRRLRRGIDVVNKYRHPLISRAMSVDGTSAFARRLDLNAFTSGFNGVLWIRTSDDQVGMTVEVMILSEGASVLGNARGKKI
jgi:hypothetical protein